MDDVEKLTRELMNITPKIGYSGLARFVLRREIAARMDELTKHISGSQEACLHKLERLAELRKQLEK